MKDNHLGTVSYIAVFSLFPFRTKTHQINLKQNQFNGGTNAYTLNKTGARKAKMWSLTSAPVWQKVKLEDDSERWKFAFNILFCSFALNFVSMSYNSSRTIWMVGIFSGYSLLILYARLGLRKCVLNIIMIIFGITSY